MSVRTWARSEDKKIEWVTLSAKYLPGALSVMRNSFYVNETISVVTGIARSEKAQEQFDSAICVIAEDGVSVIAIDVDTDTVVGVAFNKFQVKGDPETSGFLDKFMMDPDLDPAFKGFFNFISQMEERVDIFEHYGVTQILDHMFLATHCDYYLKGIGRGLVAATIDIARALNRGEDVAVPISNNKFPWRNRTISRVEAVIALFTSPISQKIGQSLEWNEILVTGYDTLFFENEPYSSRLDKNNQTNAYMSIKM